MEVSQDHYQDQSHSDFTIAVLAPWKRDELHIYRQCVHSSVLSPTHSEKWLCNLTELWKMPKIYKPHAITPESESGRNTS